MQDNVSVLIATIVAVVIIVLFPIYNVATRQDSIANNMVVRATTNFVDEVRNKGYIDKESYGKFLNELDKTGNTYDVEMEVYKPILLETQESTNENKEYEEKYDIDYTDIIIADMENADLFKDDGSIKKSDVYYLYDEYKFYVRVRNTNITQAQILLDRLISGKYDERIVVNYGGIVYSNEWEHGEDAESTGANISISRPLNNVGKEFKYEYITDIYDEYLGEDVTVYGIAVRLSDKEEGKDKIKFKLNYKKVEKLTNELGDELNEQVSRENYIRDCIDISGIAVDKEDILVQENVIKQNADGTWNYEYIITLSNISFDFANNPYVKSRVSIKPASAYTKSGPVSQVSSKEFIVFYEATEIEIEALPKYYSNSHVLIEGTGRADYARIQVGLNKTNESIAELRYAKGEFSEEEFANNPTLGTSIKETYNIDVTDKYITSKDEGVRITENGKYTIYAKDRHGREKVEVIDIIGLGSDRIKIVLNWSPDIDFDMHLIGEKNGSKVMEVYYSSKSHDSNQYGHAWLNQDNTSGGTDLDDAEIIILERAAQDMKYTCYIYDYDGVTNSFYNKKPVLTIYRGEAGSEVKIYDSTIEKGGEKPNRPWTENGSHRNWYILTYDANTRMVEFIDEYK